MKRTRLLITVFVALSLIFVFTITAASAQILDGVWFKLNVRVKGYRVDPATGDFQRYNFPMKAYLLLTYVSGSVPGTGVTYQFDAYAEIAPGDWQWHHRSDKTTITYNENFFPDIICWLYGQGGVSIYFRHTPFINIKTDSLGGFRKATYKAFGALVSGEDGAGNEIYGSVMVNGKSVKPSQLPFTP